MHRTEGTDHVDNFFNNGPPGTIVEENWLNSVQEEIIAVLTAAGITPKTAGTDTRDQLVAAITALIGEKASDAVYDASWDGVTDIAPSKNAVYDRIELIERHLAKGYIMGGYTNTNIAVIEDLIFSSETSQAIAATLDTAKYGGAGVNSATKGYIMGGNTGANTAVIEDLIFSSETSQAIAATLDTAKQKEAGVQYGYV